MNADQAKKLIKKYPSSVVNGLEKVRIKKDINHVHFYLDTHSNKTKVNIFLNHRNTYRVDSVTSIRVKIQAGINLQDAYGTEHVLIEIPFEDCELV